MSYIDPKGSSTPIIDASDGVDDSRGSTRGKDHYLPRVVKELGRRRCVLGNQVVVQKGRGKIQESRKK